MPTDTANEKWPLATVSDVTEKSRTC